MAEAELSITTENFSLAKHNATITIVSPVSGDHRTFRIRTIRKGNLEGKRVVELLTGPDNGSDFKGFGFVDNIGEIKVWERFRDIEGKSIHEKYANMLCYPERWQAKGVEYMFALRCRRCGRLLTVPESITSGYGPECIKYV